MQTQFLRQLTMPVTSLPGVGKTIAQILARLEIRTIAGLLLFYPRDYEDLSQIMPLDSCQPSTVSRVVAKVTGQSWMGFGRKRTLKLHISDNSASAQLVCFNRPFLETQAPPGTILSVLGKFELWRGTLQSTSFELQIVAPGEDVYKGLLPIYSLTEGLYQVRIRKIMKQALAIYAGRIKDELPLMIINSLNFPSKSTALNHIHFPSDFTILKKARESLIYEELFYFQISIARKINLRNKNKIARSLSSGTLKKFFLSSLPFSLTEDQKKVAQEIASDMASDKAMARLLQGDVGCGKTLVALLACLDAVERGGQAVIMAPTELLAAQHANTAAKLLKKLNLRLAYFSGRIGGEARKELEEAIKKGTVDIIIGTHTLFSDTTVYKNLNLVVIDEQHRFGVLQRLAMIKKGTENTPPDLLLMTATPIPRTLALTVFGDLSVSTIRTMPPGRKPVITHLAKAQKTDRVYEFVRNYLVKGCQAYFVYPLIGNETGTEATGDLQAAKESFDRLTRIFSEFSLGLLHSKLNEEEKDKTMEQFALGTLHIVVATTVIEVGVDVPNATIVVIEGAERFGLAALHQLRGRVGRGNEQSYCFLVYNDDITELAKARLRLMLRCNDGFLLAEEDMKMRGPGDITGTDQSGYLRFTIADLVRDALQMEAARKMAFHIIEKDPGLLLAAHNPIRNVIEEAWPFGEATGAL